MYDFSEVLLAKIVLFTVKPVIVLFSTVVNNDDANVDGVIVCPLPYIVAFEADISL